MNQELSQSATLLVAVVAVASVATWAYIYQRYLRPQGVLPRQQRLSVTWTGWHVLLVFIMSYMIFQPIALSLSGVKLDEAASKDQAEIERAFADLSPNEVASRISFVSLSSLLSVIAAAVLLMLATQATQEDLGLSEDGRQMAKEVFIGCLGFLAATLPVLSLQFIVTKLVPYHHPIFDMLSSGDNSRLWLVAGISAAVVAPITEEFFYRAVLQGWLERLALGTRDGISLQKVESDEGEQRVKLVREPVEARAVWPIWVSAAVFALMHFGQGAAPIPLLLLGALLGYIYRQTHRLIPCMVLHCLFNTFSLIIFRLSVPPPA